MEKSIEDVNHFETGGSECELSIQQLGAGLSQLEWGGSVSPAAQQSTELSEQFIFSIYKYAFEFKSQC